MQAHLFCGGRGSGRAVERTVVDARAHRWRALHCFAPSTVNTRPDARPARPLPPLPGPSLPLAASARTRLRAAQSRPRRLCSARCRGSGGRRRRRGWWPCRRWGRASRTAHVREGGKRGRGRACLQGDRHRWGSLAAPHPCGSWSCTRNQPRAQRLCRRRTPRSPCWWHPGRSRSGTWCRRRRRRTPSSWRPRT